MNQGVIGKKQLSFLDLTILTECSDRVHCIRTRYPNMLRRTLLSALAAVLLATPAFAQRSRDQNDWQRDNSYQRNDRQRGDRGRGEPFQGRDRSGSSGWDAPRQERTPQRDVSLSSVLREIKARYGGQHLDAQKMGDRYVISWITEDGRRLTIEVDANTGRILSTR